MSGHTFAFASLLLTVGFGSAAAQERHAHDHTRHPPTEMEAAPTQAGQAAFGAIAEVVRLLEADPGTDWTQVDLEKLRQHLIDMHAVTLDAVVAATPVPGGARMVVTGAGRTREAIVRMTRAHATQLSGSAAMQARVEEAPEGVVLTVTARDPDDHRTESKIRGLGFIGLMALGDHHGPHHLAMAAGRSPAGHEHD